MHYPWPGNVRELKHCIERAWVMSCGPALECEDLLSGLESVETAGHTPGADLRSYPDFANSAWILSIFIFFRDPSD